MTSITESPIFISLSETTASAADAWPLREDVFALDPKTTGEITSPDAGSAQDETYASEWYPAGEVGREYPQEMTPRETDFLVGGEPESEDGTYELDVADPQSGFRAGEETYGSPCGVVSALEGLGPSDEDEYETFTGAAEMVQAGGVVGESGWGAEEFAEQWDPGGGVSQEWMPVEEMSLDEADYGEAVVVEPGYAEAGIGETGVGEWADVEVAEDREAAEVELAESGPEAGEAFPSGLVLTVTSGPDGPDQQYWDPNSTGLPLYDTGAAVRSKKLAANFTVAELVRSGGRFDDRARISVALVQCLQAIRDGVGRAVTVTSGFRSWQRNVEVYRRAGKKPTLSRHCSGQAADIKIAGMSGMQIAKLAVDVCGERIGVGIGADFAHIDVRGHWEVWTYFTGARDSAAKAELEDHRRRRGTPPPKPQPHPTPTPTPTGTVRAGRLVVDRLPLLKAHAGTHPDLVLKWNDMIKPAAVDVVVHLHGYAAAGAAMNIVKHKEPISGLDFADPDNPLSVGRTTPTLLVLPRGNHQPHGRYGDNPERYSFSALVNPGALQQVADDALARFAGATGAPVRRNRLILTAHSGGGAALMAILAHTDPDEVHTFDAQYENPAHLIAWAQRHMAAGTGALRVLYRPHAKTAPRSPAWANARNSERIAAAVAAAGSPNFRVERTTVDHNQIPRKFGWRLLADSSGDLPGVTLSRESSDEAVQTEVVEFDTDVEFDEPGFADQEGDGEFWGDTETWEEATWQAESAPGPCPVVAIVAADRPKLLIRNSIHPAVRDAQRRLNAFHLQRVESGQHGIAWAPLVEDCIMGEKTEQALISFQRIIFPGQPEEHDGKLGPKTWAHLDTLAIGADGVAQVTVAWWGFLGPRGPLGWNDIIGLDVDAVDIEIAASGLPIPAMPPTVKVIITARPPNRIAVIGPPRGMPLSLDRVGVDPTDPSRVLYRATKTLSDFAPILGQAGSSGVATVVRIGGTSDALFRDNLAAPLRGAASQPNATGVRTSEEAGHVPDAAGLFRSGGVQVLELAAPPAPHWRVPPPVHRQARSPAQYFYYSGHGLKTGRLGFDTDTELKSCPEHGQIQTWLGPDDLLPTWRKGDGPAVLILAGCTVLATAGIPLTGRRIGPGMGWVRMLAAQQGSLTTLLGYGGKAPCDRSRDHTLGDTIATEMARRIAAGSTDLVHDWLVLNGERNATNAVAIDARGYWWLYNKLGPGYELRGPEPLVPTRESSEADRDVGIANAPFHRQEHEIDWELAAFDEGVDATTGEDADDERTGLAEAADDAWKATDYAVDRFDSTVPITGESVYDALVAEADAAIVPKPVLQSSRFAGDSTLDSVLAGGLRLAAAGTSPMPAPVVNAGPAVAKVQQALIDLGYRLPVFGADGKFGTETGSAVSEFKTKLNIYPTDPVVGRATITALDNAILARDHPIPPPPVPEPRPIPRPPRGKDRCPAPPVPGGALGPGDHVWYFDGKISTEKDIPRTDWFKKSKGPGDYENRGGEIYHYVIHSGGQIFRGQPHMKNRPGTWAWLNNNPGNLTGVPGGPNYGQYKDKFNWNCFLIFPSFQVGFDAIAQFLRNGRYPAGPWGSGGLYRNLSITETFRRYAPKGHGQNTPEVYAAQVAAAAGVSETTLVGALDTHQMRKMQEKICKIEGTRKGEILTRDHPDLPAAVRAALA